MTKTKSRDHIAEEIVKIDFCDSMLIIAAEFNYIESVLGTKGQDWNLASQALTQKNGIFYDVLTVVDRNGIEKKFYFDISELYKDSASSDSF